MSVRAILEVLRIGAYAFKVALAMVVGGDRRAKRRFMMSSGGCGGLGVGGRCLMLSAVAITLVAVVTIAISRETAVATVAIECM